MKTLRRMIHREALVSVAYATLVFLALFFFFDLVDELRSVNRYSTQGYDFARALLVTALTVPGHLYELLPITVLIGTIFVMARFAQSSEFTIMRTSGIEFTIMRTSGMGPGQALRTLLLLGGFFVVLTFVVGDYVAPQSDRLAETLKMRFTGRISSKAMGAWLKERQQENSFAVNVRALTPDGKMLDVRIFEFDATGQLASHTHAASAQFGEDGASWMLEQAQRSRFHLEDEAHAWVERTQAASLAWPTHIKAEMVSATLRKRERMTTLDLFEYIRHLKANGQTAQRYEIELGGAGAAVCVPALPLGRHFGAGVRRHHGGAELFPAQQPVQPRRQPAKPVALDRRRGAQPDLFAAVARGLRLAGVAPLKRRPCRTVPRPSSCLRTARAIRSGVRP